MISNIYSNYSQSPSYFIPYHVYHFLLPINKKFIQIYDKNLNVLLKLEKGKYTVFEKPFIAGLFNRNNVSQVCH